MNNGLRFKRRIRLRRNLELRIQLVHWRGSERLDIRKWVRNARGKFVATPKGVSVRMVQAPDVANAVKQAARRAVKRDS